MNRPARATKAEIDRALRAAKEAGPEFGVEIAPDGTIRILPLPPQHTGKRRSTGLAERVEVIL